MPRMAGLKGEAGASPVLSRNCNARMYTSEARSPASIGLCRFVGMGDKGTAHQEMMCRILHVVEFLTGTIRAPVLLFVANHE